MSRVENYSVPREAQRVFEDGILNNPLHAWALDLHSLAKNVQFEGAERPSIPINWRFAESISSLKALEATMINYLNQKKYNAPPADVTINT